MQFFWAAGHIGWPFFAIIVFSVLCFLAIDIAWRTIHLSFVKLAMSAALPWLVGVVVIIVSYLSISSAHVP